MKYNDYLSSDRQFLHYPHNIVTFTSRDGKLQTFFVEDRILPGIAAGGPLARIEQVAQQYMEEHPDTTQANIFEVDVQNGTEYQKFLSSVLASP